MSRETRSSRQAQLVLAWGVVGVPLAYGLFNTLKTAVKLFG